jgi:hypothetical protein
VIDAVAMPAGFLIRDALLENLLAFGRKRRLLEASRTFRLVERRLARESGDDEPVPLPLQVGIL